MIILKQIFRETQNWHIFLVVQNLSDGVPVKNYKLKFLVGSAGFEYQSKDAKLCFDTTIRPI